MALEVAKLDPQFKYDVAAQPGGQNIKVCFACGICTAGCPVAEIDPGYNPRKIIRMVLLGMRREVLSSEAIWLCSSCYTCSAHCPQNVRFADVMAALRRMAVQEGYASPSFLGNIKGIDRLAQKLRRQMVLAVVNRRQEDFELAPEDLLQRVTA